LGQHTERRLSCGCLLDRYPCTPGHRLYVPRYDSEMLMNQCLTDALTRWSGHGSRGRMRRVQHWHELGPAAGQTVMYPHIHLIPRRTGDVEDPVGGVRNTIPGKGNYKK
jgi:ATP adenylyltransferase